MKHKLFSIFLVLCLLTVIAIPAMAFTDDGMPFVTDSADILSDEELSSLEQTAKQISNTYQCGIYVTIVPDYTAFAGSMFDALDGIYQSQSLGYGSSNDGLMLLLSMAERDYYLQSYGETGGYAFNASGLDALEDEFLDDFADDDWYNGLSDYLQWCDTYLFAAEDGMPIGGEEGNFSISVMIAAVISCVIALIVCLILKAQLRSVHKGTSATEYMDAESFDLQIQQDRYTHTTRVRRKIESSSSSSGSSSGGGSGRGGKF